MSILQKYLADETPRKERYAQPDPDKSAKRRSKTYNSGDSPVVTHPSTNLPVSCLYMAERTGSLILKILWSYVKELQTKMGYNLDMITIAHANYFGKVYWLSRHRGTTFVFTK